MERSTKLFALAVVVLVIIASSAAAITVTIIELQKENTPEQQYMNDLHFQKFEKYFYGVDYSKVNYSYDYGFEFCKEHYGTNADIDSLPGCSAVTAGNMFGRCFDWFINESPVFLIRTAGNAEHKYSTLGIATFIKGVSDDDVKDGKFSERYWDLPFFTTDGMNEKGLTMCLNVSNIYEARTTGTNPGMPDMSILMCVRYILDNAATIGEAVDIINSYNIYSPNSDMINEEFHYLISDANGDSVLVEFAKNTPHFLYEEQVMTNFDMTCFYDENDHRIMDWEERLTYEREEGNAVFDLIPNCPMGIERYVTLLKNYTDDCSTDPEAMFELMKKVYYTQAYTLSKEEGRWYSEQYKGEYNKHFPVEIFDTIIELSGELLKYEPRNDVLWQTVHCCVYDRETMSLYVAVQENPEMEYHFTL